MTPDSRGFIHTAVVLTVVLIGLTLNLPIPTAISSELEMSGFTIVQDTVSGRWEIQARKAFYKDEREVILNGVAARMTSGGKEQINVVSDRGRYESDRLVLHLEGNVVVGSKWGSSLRAPVVRWDGAGAWLEASGGVKLQRGPILVSGMSARYTIDTGTTWILGEVRTVLDIGGSGQ